MKISSQLCILGRIIPWASQTPKLCCVWACFREKEESASEFGQRLAASGSLPGVRRAGRLHDVLCERRGMLLQVGGRPMWGISSGELQLWYDPTHLAHFPYSTAEWGFKELTPHLMLTHSDMIRGQWLDGGTDSIESCANTSSTWTDLGKLEF